MVHKQIERMKRKLSEIEVENAQYKARLEDVVAQAEEQRRMKRKLSEIEVENAQYKARLEDVVAQAEEQRRTIQNKLLVIEALQKRFSEKEETHIATQNHIQSLEEERMVLQSHNTVLMQSLNASQGENTNLCEQCAEISGKNATLIKEEHSRKQEVRNAKRSVLRSFNWREKNVDDAVLRGAVAFWGATKAPGHLENGENKRISCRARKQILKVIIEQGFNGELHDELEKEFMDKIRFKVFALAKKSDLESKFNSEAIGSIAHCQPGHEKHMRGIIPSATTVNNFLQGMNAKAAELGLSCMPKTST
jgi:DNA repair exonuclease SbcCD ATPase subunit